MRLSEAHKKKIFKTYFNTFFFKHYKYRENLANIAGFSVSFCDYQSLSTLFVEIFLNQEYYFSTDSSRPVILDCGSNIGMAALYFKFLYPNAFIRCFEPDDSAFRCLQKNVYQNALNNIDCHHLAIMANPGEVTFYHDKAKPAALTMSTRKERMSEDEYCVKADVLSNYFDEDVDCLKLDVEGAENDVLMELIYSKKIIQIRRMIIEYHHHIEKDSDNFSNFLSLLEQNGFGYQIEGKTSRPFKDRTYQDFLIYAYNKS